MICPTESRAALQINHIVRPFSDNTGATAAMTMSHRAAETNEHIALLINSLRSPMLRQLDAESTISKIADTELSPGTAKAIMLKYMVCIPTCEETAIMWRKY
jgi:hypothetical protein